MRAVLCVDDDELITQMVSFQLKKHLDPSEFLIESVNDPNRVIKVIDDLNDLEIPTVLIIVDYQMPGKNGAELIRELKVIAPTLKFIMLSGQANNSVVNELQEEQLINNFIHKPWSEEELTKAVLGHL